MNQASSLDIIIIVFPILIIPSAFYIFTELSKAITIIREKHPKNYIELGSPRDMFYRGKQEGDIFSFQFFFMALLFYTPSAVPNDPEVLKKIKRVQMCSRIINLIGLPVIIFLYLKN